MKAREYETFKSSDGLKSKVETKVDMKTRLLFSPDLADCFFIALHLARTRLAFIVEGLTIGGGGSARFIDIARSRDSVNHNLYAPAE